MKISSPEIRDVYTTKVKEIRFRVTRNQFERIQNMAEAKGKTLAQYMRSITLEKDLNLVNKVIDIYEMLRNMFKMQKDLHTKYIKGDKKIK